MLNDTKITEPMYLDKKVLKIVKKALDNPESEISKTMKEKYSDESVEDIATSGKTIILNGGTADE